MQPPQILDTLLSLPRDENIANDFDNEGLYRENDKMVCIQMYAKRRPEVLRLRNQVEVQTL